jgi:DsbC/DsbD-like thiol-disulfide interchange protein
MEDRASCETRVERRRYTAIILGIALELVVLAAACGASAEDRPPQVNAHMLLATDAAHAGSKIKLAVVAEIPSGFHINDHKPTLEYLIPTEIILNAPKPLAVEQVFYPRGEARKFSFEDTPLSVYEGTVVVGVLVDVSTSAAPGDYSLQGKFSYQACNNQACFPPSSVPVAASVKVVGEKVPLKPENQDVFRRASFK